MKGWITSLLNLVTFLEPGLVSPQNYQVWSVPSGSVSLSLWECCAFPESANSSGHWGQCNDCVSPAFCSDIGNTPEQCMGPGKGRVLPSKPELLDSAVDHATPGSSVGLGCSLSAFGLVWPLASLQIWFGDAKGVPLIQALSVIPINSKEVYQVATMWWPNDSTLPWA